MNAEDACPCGRPRTLAECCLPIVDGSKPALSAEDLMRSRYSAHAIMGQNEEALQHLLRSWSSGARDTLDAAEIHAWATKSDWLGLRVLRTAGGGPLDQEGVVEFEAAYRDAEGEHLHHEVSRFAREEGRWVYVDALD